MPPNNCTFKDRLADQLSGFYRAKIGEGQSRTAGPVGADIGGISFRFVVGVGGHIPAHRPFPDDVFVRTVVAPVDEQVIVCTTGRLIGLIQKVSLGFAHDEWF